MMELGKGINLCNNSEGCPGGDYYYYFNSPRDFVMAKISRLTFIHVQNKVERE